MYLLDFERRLREEEIFGGWEINQTYVNNVEKSFDDDSFDNAISLLVYIDNLVVGRIDESIIYSHFDGTKKAYLDWICVIKSSRHQEVAQHLLEALRKELKDRNIDTLVGLTFANEEAQHFYKIFQTLR